MFVLYRVVMALYFASMQVWLMTDWTAESLIFLTNWSFFVLTVTVITQAVVAVYHYVTVKKAGGKGR